MGVVAWSRGDRATSELGALPRAKLHRWNVLTLTRFMSAWAWFVLLLLEFKVFEFATHPSIIHKITSRLLHSRYHLRIGKVLFLLLINSIATWARSELAL